MEPPWMMHSPRISARGVGRRKSIEYRNPCWPSGSHASFAVGGIGAANAVRSSMTAPVISARRRKQTLP